MDESDHGTDVVTVDDDAHAPHPDDGHHHGDHGHHDHHHGRSAAFGPWVLVVPLLAAVVLRNRVPWFENETVRLWSTLFVSICIQALPFLVLGVVISGLIAAFVSPDFVQRVVPKRPVFAVPAAGVAGMALPGCECGSVPIAGRLVAAGTPPGTRCDQNEVTMDVARVQVNTDADANDVLTRDAAYDWVFCHEAGHAVGLDHYDKTPGAEQLNQPDCMRSHMTSLVGNTGTNMSTFHQYSAHHLTAHLNAWF